jgi:RND family efflux transporter MFP subunit
LNDNYIRSPIDGKITDINAKRGEVVSPSEAIVDLLSLEPFQIKADIYEQDIVNVKVGDSVKINLVAFPKQTFDGKVVLIDPAEKIVDNVVYYQITIDFPNQPNGIRSAMTSDIVIQTNKKDNVLRLPKNAVDSINGTEIVQVVSKSKIENREIKIGLEGNEYYEVLSGIDEGEEIITGKK